MANLDRANLISLVRGNYIIRQESHTDTSIWTVFHMGADGKVAICKSDGGQQSWVWKTNATPLGAEGLLMAPKIPNQTVLVAGEVYDPETGTLAFYSRVRKLKLSWVQKEMPAFAAVNCDRMPRSALLNNAQVGGTIKDMSAAAKPIRGVPVLFKNPISDPVTNGLYTWAYPYDQ